MNMTQTAAKSSVLRALRFSRLRSSRLKWSAIVLLVSSSIAGCTSNSMPPAISVTIAPSSASVQAGKQQQFTATVSNTNNSAVNWQVNGNTGGDSTHGTISTSGLFTAPSSVPNPASVTVSAVSQADSSKSAASMVTITAAPDTIPPSAPTNLAASAASSSQINLSWTASTDNVGVTGYRVERCQGAGCSNFSQIATPTSASYNDTGLTASTSYSYRVRATDAANNLSNYSNTASATTLASSANISVTISPKRGGLTTTQTLSVNATVTGDSSNLGVTWSATGGGSFSSASSASGTPVTYTAPGTAGSVTITATSKADVTKSASATLGVTNLAGVFTYHNDLSRDGANTQEYALNTSNVATATFGKLFSCTMDGAVYAQPLWMANLTIGSAKHNVALAVSMRDTAYLFDADANPCVTLWSKTLIPSGETYGSSSDVGTADIYPDIGILGTPVIDPSTNAVYLVTKTKTSPGGVFHQRLHALNLLDGSERTNSPVDLTSSITVPGTGDTGDSSCPSTNGNVPFCPLRLNQRPGLALVNGVVYVSWASHGDNQPYHGWVLGFSTSSLSRVATYNDSPNGREGGIWMAGGAPAADSSNNIYVITGNGDYDGVNDFGDSFLKLSTSSGLSLSDWFTPSNQASLDASDLDLGSGGAVVLIDLPSAPVGHQHLLVGGGKGAGFAGEFYVLNRDNLGKNAANDGGVVQEFSSGGGIFSTPGFWNNVLYIAPVNKSLSAYALNPSTGMFNATPGSSSSASYGFPGATPSVSANGTTNGIVWVINSNSCGSNSNNCSSGGPAVLHAYDANNLATELWDSSQGSGNAAGDAVKFTVPTVANGKVYVPTRGNDTTTNSPTVRGEIDVYGLLPN